MKHYVNEVGTSIILNAGVDISDATTLQILYTKPNGTTGAWTAEPYNTNYAKYDLQTNDLDVAGVWTFQISVVSPAWTGKGEEVQETIYPDYASSIAAIVPGTNSFCALAEAESYFITRLGSGVWSTSALSDKVAALVTAFRQLIGCGLFDIAATDTAQAVKDAQCEMALFLLVHQEDMDSRAGLQAQGVIEAGIVQEKYRSDAPMVPANVVNLLSAYILSSPIYATDITRDDDE